MFTITLLCSESKLHKSLVYYIGCTFSYFSTVVLHGSNSLCCDAANIAGANYANDLSMNVEAL